jgi:hypothetical protein
MIMFSIAAICAGSDASTMAKLQRAKSSAQEETRSAILSGLETPDGVLG